MDERKTSPEPEARRKNPENPLLQTDGRKKAQRKTDPETKEHTVSRKTLPEGNTQQNVYKLRVLTIILVLLIVALIAAFISEIGIYGRQGSRINGNTAVSSAFVQEEQIKRAEPGQRAGAGGSLAVL